MSLPAPHRTQQPFHRQVTWLLLGVFTLLGVLESMSPAAIPPSSRVAPYAVLVVWAALLARRKNANVMGLVFATLAHTAALAAIEAAYGMEVSIFDSTSFYALAMMTAILGATLASKHRLAWSISLALAVAGWSVWVGMLQGGTVGALLARGFVALSGVVFTSVLVSRLFDLFAIAVSRYEQATRLQSAIAACSEALLVQTDTRAVSEAARSLLQATGADYVYVDHTEMVDGEPRWRVVADAIRPGSPHTDGWVGGSYASNPTNYLALVAGRSVEVHLSELTGEERAMYAEAGIQSEVNVPIFVDGEFRGSIGFVDFVKDRRWSAIEVEALWRAAQMIGAYWRRQDFQKALQESNESKDRLLASVSHEIRTPLTAVVGLAQEVAQNQAALSTDELAELYGIIATQGRELAGLVEDLLVASRAESGSLTIRPDWVDLHGEAESVLRAVREAHPVEKEIVVRGNGVKAWADGLRCRQILRNLIGNAVKYGGDRIVVESAMRDGRAVLSVSDNGPGVAEAERELIFERFYRGQESPTMPGSVGIGLAVSRQLAEMMGGSLRYSGGEGDSRFELVLPAEPEPALIG